MKKNDVIDIFPPVILSNIIGEHIYRQAAEDARNVRGLQSMLRAGVAYAAFFLFVIILPTGCRSAFINVTIQNNSGATVKLIEVDYPSASFGTGSLASGAQFRYHFKVQGSGAIKMQFIDSAGKTHTAIGPELAEGQQGTLAITIGTGDEISWQPTLSKKE